MSSTCASPGSDELTYLTRVVLICKPEQSGKTFVMIQQIIKDITYPSCDKVIVNIIFCDNNLLLTRQTSTRVGDALPKSEIQINDETYLEFSSHSRTAYHDANAVIGGIIRNINNILCCTNGTRVDDTFGIIEGLQNNPATRDRFFFKIWLDEADKYYGFIDSTFKPLVEKYENVALYCITATPKALFMKYQALNVFPLENTTSPEYHGWTDNKIQTFAIETNCLGFAKHILEHHTAAIVPGSKWFIPAELKKKTHESMAKLCGSFGMATIIVNGEGVKFYLPNRLVVVEKKTDELNKILLKIYREHDLHNYPLAITGNLCVSRGISMMSKDLIFDYGILSCCNNPQQASQDAGRLKGNMKSWPAYKPPVVFTTPKFDKIAIEWEKKSRALAELAFKKQADGLSTIITKNEFKTVGEDYEYIVHPELFKTFAKANVFLKTKSREMKCKVTTSKGKVIHNTSGGYSVTSKLLKAGQTVADLCNDDARVDMAKAETISPSTCISTNKGSAYLIIPVYETMSSPPKSVMFQVRYLKYK